MKTLNLLHSKKFQPHIDEIFTKIVTRDTNNFHDNTQLINKISRNGTTKRLIMATASEYINPSKPQFTFSLYSPWMNQMNQQNHSQPGTFSNVTVTKNV